VKAALLLLLATLCSCGESGPPEPAWGVVIVVQVTTPHDAPRGAAEATARILEKNLATLGYPHARATLPTVDRMSIRVPGANEAGIREVGWAILDEGWMHLHEAADAITQAAFSQTPNLPAGYQVVENVGAASRPGPPWDADKILIKSESLIQSGMIADAWAEGNDVIFRVNKERRTAFEAAARRGPLVLLFVGRASYAGRVGLDAPGGDGLIPAFGNIEPKHLAFSLMARRLPVKIGRGNSCTMREVESVEFFGTPPAKAP
jgi:hypothetical protein